MDWCGEFGEAVWVARTLSPCLLESSSAVLLVVVAVPVLIVQWVRMKRLERQRQQAHCQSQQTGMTGIETTFVLGTLMLVALHTAHLIVSAIILRDLPFHVAYNGVFLMVWVGVLIVSWVAGIKHLAVGFRPVVIVAGLSYCVYVYCYVCLYIGSVVFPATYVKSQVWSAMLAVMFCVLLLVMEFKNVRVGLVRYKPLHCGHFVQWNCCLLRWSCIESYAIHQVLTVVCVYYCSLVLRHQHLRLMGMCQYQMWRQGLQISKGHGPACSWRHVPMHGQRHCILSSGCWHASYCSS